MEELIRLVDILAWPLTVVGLVLLLKSPVIQLITQLKKLKYKDLELEFEKELDILSKDTERALRKTDVQRTATDEEVFLALMRGGSPRAAILNSWLDLEFYVLRIAKEYDLLPKDKPPLFHLAVRGLLKAGVITDDDLYAINSFQALRNKAAHLPEFTITEDDALKFWAIARDQAALISAKTAKLFGKK